MRAHKVIEAIRYSGEASKHYPGQTDKKNMDYMRGVARRVDSAIKFDFCDLMDYPYNLESIKLPYPEIYVQLPDVLKDYRNPSALMKEVDGGIDAEIFLDDFHADIMASVIMDDDKTLEVRYECISSRYVHLEEWETQEMYGEGVGSALHMALSAMLIMNCSNVDTEEHPEPKHLNRKRAKKGRPPIYSYHTLKIRPSKVHGDYHGGTHRSPRLHLRRGHIRNCASGITTWVSPCMVGNADKGVVEKDYRYQSN